jgi:hypothetical protein
LKNHRSTVDEQNQIDAADFVDSTFAKAAKDGVPGAVC